MRVGKTNTKQYPYKLKEGNKQLEYSEAEKDIGVIIDQKLSFEAHMQEKINKAKSLMGLIRRTMEYMDTSSFKGTHTVYFSSSLYIINQEPMIPRTRFHCITTWVARSSE